MCFNYSKHLGKNRKIIHKIKTTFKKVLDQSTSPANYKSQSVKCVICYLHQNKQYKIQNQSPRGVLLKRSSSNPQQIYSIAPMQKCYVTFFEIAFPDGYPPVNLLHICRTLLKKSYGGLLLKMTPFYKQIINVVFTN